MQILLFQVSLLLPEIIELAPLEDYLFGILLGWGLFGEKAFSRGLAELSDTSSIKDLFSKLFPPLRTKKEGINASADNKVFIIL